MHLCPVPFGTQGVRWGCLRMHRLLYHPPHFLSLHHHRYVDCAVGAACTASGGVAHAAQPVSLAHTAMRFSSPGDLPSSTAFSRCQWQSGTPLSCARRLLSSWQRMQSSRSLQPRGGRGFTALTSSYPRKVVAFNQSWICEFWTGLYTSSRCGRAGALSNASSPRIGFQRSTWRMLTFMFHVCSQRSQKAPLPR